LIAIQTVENVVFNCVPILSTAARIAIEMVAAMRAYSMARMARRIAANIAKLPGAVAPFSIARVMK